MFARLRREILQLVDELIELAYFMRGAITYDQMLERTPGERDRIAKFVKKRLDQESKHMHPNY